MPEMQYPKNPNSDTVFVVQEDGTKNRALMTAPQDTSTLELPSNANSTKGYVTIDGKKQRVILTADISGGGGGGSGGVSSVNGQTGDVTLTASDVGALPTSGGTMTGTISSESNTPLTVKQGTYNHSISFSGPYSTPSISMFTGSVGNRPIVSLPKVIATEIASGLFKRQSNDGGFSLPRGSGYIAVQVDTMPTAGSVFLGNVVQFIGTTDSTYTHGHLYECVSDGGNPATYSWSEVQPAGATYTAGNGISIDANNEISVTDPVLVNNSQYGLAIGGNASCQTGVALGSGSAAEAGVGNVCVAVGVDARAYGWFSVQLGQGDNRDANTLKVGQYVNGDLQNYELLSEGGTVPTARLTKVNTTITLTAAGWSNSSQTVNVTGMTADGVVMVSPTPANQSAYTSAGILCTAQAAGSLTFTCDTVPSADITVTVVML